MEGLRENDETKMEDWGRMDKERDRTCSRSIMEVRSLYDLICRSAVACVCAYVT